ncbi:hypothetical protein TNIN_499451, partial [Trichonephila inaurata madagascariensis]
QARNDVDPLVLNVKKYDESIKALKERFEKKDIISQFMNKLLKLDSLRNPNNVKDSRNFYHEIKITYRNLDAQGVTKEFFGEL